MTRRMNKPERARPKLRRKLLRNLLPVPQSRLLTRLPLLKYLPLNPQPGRAHLLYISEHLPRLMKNKIR
jgi:hypothetical protein